MLQSARRQYLQAMGIECYVLRGRRAEGSAVAPDARERPPVPAAALAQRPVAVVRQLLDGDGDGDRAATGDGVAATGVPPGPARPRMPDADQVPHFRLCVLDLEGSLLLLDEELLSQGELRKEQLQLLGDLLRTARILRHGDASGDVQIQSFYWPQVEDRSLDQSLPRAREALAHYLRERTRDRGPVLWLGAPNAPPASASAMVDGSAACLDGPAVQLNPELLDVTAPGTVRASAWRALEAMGAAT